MDIINPEVSYAFDLNKPSPMQQLSSLEEKRKSPQDGPSTQRLRNVMMTGSRKMESVSRPDGDGDDVQPWGPLLSRSESTARAGVSSGGSNVMSKVAMFEDKRNSVPHRDLRALGGQSRKSLMKPKAKPRNIVPLPFQQLDPDATRPSGFASSSKPSKGKTAENRVSVHLPLKGWSIGLAVSPREVTPEPLVNLVWESGFLKVRDASGSTQFELQVKNGSVDNVKYVDVKRNMVLEPLIQIHPSVLATVQNHAEFAFEPGSTDPDGLLTFKFDTSASDWDNDVYMGVVKKLADALSVNDGKSILDLPAARAVWEAVMRVHESQPASSDPEPMPLHISKENPPNPPPSKPRARLRPRTDASTIVEIPVRRSARLSGGEQKRYSPRPDPDEVILGYRSGTGSLNITNGDVSRLNHGEFLNDTLIEFGLKLWLADLHQSNPELASQVHVFSSFFYKKLSTKIPEEGYNSVKKWTSRFDLFQKKYIIVPINENLHWYLAIIYFPEHTLLVRPVQETIVHPRRSTRRIGVIIDSPEALQPDPASRQSLPPDPDPPPNGQVHTVPSSELIGIDSPRTDDQKDEIDVERMVESGLSRADPTAKEVRAASPDTLVTQCPESPTLVYPHSSPITHPATLPTSDPQGDGAEQLNHPASLRGSEEDITRISGIPTSTFYGTKSQGRGDVTPQLATINNSALPEPEIEIEEDATIGNPESEPEEAAEHPRTYIFTLDSLASKHPQAVKRLSRYLLMEAHDKKQLEEATLNEPKGMQAIVPHQPNYCDCGIYLLHFAKTFMKDPRLSSDIIRNRSSPQKGRRVPHEHWDGASVGKYRDELKDRIESMSKEWKKQRSEHDPGTTKNETDGGGRGGSAAPPQQQQPHGDPTPTTSSKAETETDSDIEVLCTPQKDPLPKAPRKYSGSNESRKRGPAVRLRG
jgi:Ulp1 family protease